MPDNKSQHFVPQMLLRNFAVNEKKTAIALYNLPESIFVPFASIRDQACREYFYGKDLTIEKSLQQIESSAATILSNILSTGSLPLNSSPAHVLLSAFVVFLLLRTPSASEDVSRTVNSAAKFAFSMYHPEAGDLQGYEISTDKPVIMSLSHAGTLIPYMMDLDMVLILNDSNIPFVCGDHPVARYNQLFEQMDPGQFRIGLGVSGLQVFVPISPKACLFYFDPAAYRIDSNASKVVSHISSGDVFGLNLLQAINAFENLYFDAHLAPAYLSHLEKRSLAYRKRDTPSWEKILAQIKGEPGIHEVYTMASAHNLTRLSLSFCRLRMSARHLASKPELVKIRNPELRALQMEFRRLVEEGKLHSMDFMSFLGSLASSVPDET